jgi:dolichol-phosphate mannosyltransferase
MITIIIPLFNERENVIHYDKDLFSVVENISHSTNEKFSYIFVDDGSRDDTVEQLRKITDNRTDVKIIEHHVNRGMGSAIKTGLGSSNGDLIITMDADLTFRPVDITILIKKYRETHADCISGSPYLEKGLMEEVTPFRLLMSKSVNFLYRLILGNQITCVSPIFRLYKLDALHEMVISSNNYEINAEILSKLIIRGKRVVEVAVPLLKRKYGVSKINVLKEIKNNIFLLYRIVKTKYFFLDWK